MLTVVFVVIEELQCHAVPERRVVALSDVDANAGLDGGDCSGCGNQLGSLHCLEVEATRVLR